MNVSLAQADKGWSEQMFCPQTIRETRRKFVTGVQAIRGHCYIIRLRVLDPAQFPCTNDLY